MTNPDSLVRPALLAPAHEVNAFHCGEPSLDEWLRERATADLAVADTKIYVVALAGLPRVIGYYALGMGRILSEEVVGFTRRTMSRDIPSLVLGRLAIDTAWQGRGLGRALLHDAVMRSLRMSRDGVARLLVAHAISPEAASFYHRHGFARLPVETPMLALDLIKAAAVAQA